ncbi:unnamed protein product [Phytophthora lilii]|uniref:Unnamed protein product n=1 Tax=Phytophthora lilii TaxID=2077276 RepID=A0A9W6WQ59_9STRA|nr:unnamed protein product [Phytophthora lilii]
MPKDQLHQQLKHELGEDWRSKFQEFDDVPIAAASIGQVHRATLLNGDRVAIKIQYPGVAESIGSDLLNLKRLVTYTNILPRGLYIDEIIRVGKEELTAECDYLNEAENQERFKELIEQNGMGEKYVVPRVYRELSTSRILTTQLISGVAVDKAVHLSQDVRNSIARRILELTIHELFNWRFMQTDPNWSNFMYNASTDTIGLVDFGAAREYPKAFVDDYFNIVWAAANEDEKTLVDYSIKMHFLTGDESPAMMRAHIAAGMVVGEPFRSDEPFDFQKSKLTTRLGQHTEVFMHGRLTPPPQEGDSLTPKRLRGAKGREEKDTHEVRSSALQQRYQLTTECILQRADIQDISATHKAPDQEDPFERFRKMIKVGVPRPCVEDKMRKDGINPAGLDGVVPKGDVYIAKSLVPVQSVVLGLTTTQKRWYWSQVPKADRVAPPPEGSIWTQVSEKGATQRISARMQAHLLRLYTNDCNTSAANVNSESVGSVDSNAVGVATTTNSSKATKLGKVQILEGRKGMILEMVVKHIEIPFRSVANDINLLTAVYLQVPDIKTIVALWPSAEEERKLDEFSGDYASLGILNTSNKYVNVMRVLRDFGNFINGQEEEVTYSRDFSLESLNALTNTKAYAGNESFMDSFVDMILLDYADESAGEKYLVNFYEEINQVPLCKGVSVNALKAELNMLRQGLKMVRETAKSSRPTGRSLEDDKNANESRDALTGFADEMELELRGVEELFGNLDDSVSVFTMCRAKLSSSHSFLVFRPDNSLQVQVRGEQAVVGEPVPANDLPLRVRVQGQNCYSQAAIIAHLD